MPLIPMTPQEQLARHIPEKRRRLKMTQSELAQRTGTSQAAIARLETGRGNPTVNLIMRVATILNLELTLYIRPQR